ncbi:MAG: hypothetical protein FJ385_09700, partial [Verrucomicrobia bacterium]|nr:hypothetical protein [Verrucomicrobiota bacterium]
VNGNIGIEVVPYGNPTAGVVRRNAVNAGYIGLLHGRHDKGAGAWSWEDNTLTVAPNLRSGLATLVQQPWLYKIVHRGIQMSSFGEQGSGANPQVSFTGNGVDGSLVNSPFISSTEGFRLADPFGAGSIAIAGNTFANVNHGVDDTRVVKLDLASVLANNTFPAGMIIDRNRITDPPPPIIITAGTPSALTAVYGSSSAASSFLLFGSYLRAGITVNAPAGFEVSGALDAPFAASATFGSTGTLNSTSVYVRLAAGTAAGAYAGNLLLTTPEGASKTVAIPSSTVSPKPLVVTASPKAKLFGDPDPALTYVSGGLLPGDSLSGSLVRAAGEATGSYAISRGTLDAGPNYQLLFIGAAFTIDPLPTLEGDFEQRPLWSAGFGGALYDNAAAVVPATDGGAWVLGDFEGNVTFGTTSLQSTGGELSDLVLVRVAANGSVQSARKFGGANSEFARCATALKDGAFVIGGVFSTATTIGTTTLNSAGSQDIVLAKLDADGNPLWTKRFGGTSSDNLWAVTADVDDQLFLTGQFAGSITFGTTTLTSSGSSDGFIVKLDAAGDVVWARRIGGTGSDIAYAVALDDDGRIAVAGQFTSSGTFGSVVLSSAGGTDAFVTVLDASGTFLWANRFGGTTADVARAVTFDMAGTLWVAGQFTGSSATGFGEVPFASAGSEDIFVARLTAATGNLESASRYGGSGYDIATALDYDPYGSVVLAGNFNQTIAFGVNSLTSAGSTDCFVAKLHPVFGELWARSGGGTGSDSAEAVAINGSGEIFLAGRFDANASFDNQTITGGGLWDLFVTKINGVAPVVTGQPTAVNIDLGDPWQLTATHQGAGPITFQWFKNGEALEGATSAALAVTSASAEDAGSYALQISSPYGTTTTQSASIVVRVPAQTISLTTDATIGESRNIAIPLYLDHDGSVNGLGIEIPYDDRYLSNVGFSLGPNLPAGKFTVSLLSSPTRVRITGSAYPSSIPGGRKLLGTFTATTRSAPEGTTLHFSP